MLGGDEQRLSKVKKTLLTIILLSSGLSAGELKLGFYSVFSEDDRSAMTAISEIEAKADRTIRCDREKNFDLGLGKIVNGARHRMELKFEEIESFLKNERHKNLIVVDLDKSVMWNQWDFVSQRVEEVLQQMTALGYKRVVILGAHGSGVYYLADSLLKTEAAKPEATGENGEKQPQSKTDARPR